MPDPTTPIITTTRAGLLIQPHRDHDFADLPAFMNDPSIFNNTLSVPHPYGEEELEQFKSIVQTYNRSNPTPKDFAITLNDRLIGGIGLLYNHGFESHKSEFGYWLGAPFRNRGYMHSAASAFVNYVFTETHLLRLEAHVFTTNPASVRVLERCGFRREGQFSCAFRKDETFLDAYFYARLHPSL